MTLSRTIADKLHVAMHWVVPSLGYGMVRLNYPFRQKALQTVVDAHRNGLLMTPVEAIQLYEAALAVANLPGDVAEVGVYRGASARLMSAALPGKMFHLFDTFSGLPESGDFCHAGDFSAAEKFLSANMAGRRFEAYRGIFPRDTGHLVADTQFCLVNLDVDLYEGTYGSLQFFWPRMVPGGIIISHDHPLIDGVAKAFTDFFRENRGTVIQLSGNQVMAVKSMGM